MFGEMLHRAMVTATLFILGFITGICFMGWLIWG
jgi:hypothetical protein